MEKKIRLATAILDFSVKKGGAERYLMDLCTRLTKEGYEVHVYSNRWDKEIPGTFLHKVNTIPFPRSLRLLLFVIRSTKEIEKNNYDITLSIGNTIKADILQPRGGVHWAWFWKSLRAYENPIIWLIKFIGRILSPKQWANGLIEILAYRNQNVHKIIAISEMIKEDMMHWYKVPENQIIVDYNGIDTEFFHPRNKKYREEIRKDLGIGDEFIILFVSNNFRMKGLHYLIRATAKIKKEKNIPLKLVVLGRDRKNPYIRLSKRLGVSKDIIFIGSTDSPEKYYGASDLLVHPTFYDACSRVVLEAMATGIPIITTTANGACGILTNNEEGIIISDPRNVELLTESILSYMEKERNEKSSIKARQCIEKYSFEKNIEMMKKIFLEILEKKLNVNKKNESSFSG